MADAGAILREAEVEGGFRTMPGREECVVLLEGDEGEEVEEGGDSEAGRPPMASSGGSMAARSMLRADLGAARIMLSCRHRDLSLFFGAFCFVFTRLSVRTVACCARVMKSECLQALSVYRMNEVYTRCFDAACEF